MDEGLSENHRRVMGSGMLIVDAAAVRMLNLLENRSSPAAMNVIENMRVVRDTKLSRLTMPP